jgi:hypothetical protein
VFRKEKVRGQQKHRAKDRNIMSHTEAQRTQRRKVNLSVEEIELSYSPL